MEDPTVTTYVYDQIRASCSVQQRILDSPVLLAKIEEIGLRCLDVYRNGGKLLLAGNGGSAADAQHIAAELVSRFYRERRALRCLALTTNTSVLTAVANDYDYQRVFARQVEAHGDPGDLMIGLSTSGNSANVIEALRVCETMGITTVGLTGAAGGKMPALCDLCVNVPSDETPRIQESHILIGHIICAVIEDFLFGGGH